MCGSCRLLGKAQPLEVRNQLTRLLQELGRNLEPRQALSGILNSFLSIPAYALTHTDAADFPFHFSDRLLRIIQIDAIFLNCYMYCIL